MITTNISNQDGLTNEAVGVLRRIIKTKNMSDEKLLDKCVYLEFGKMSRQYGKIRKYMKDDCVEEKNEWIIIEYKTEKINRSNQGFCCNRIQFNFVEAEAITIHKSQGQTYQCVTVDIEKPLPTSILHVSLSRCTQLKNLYLFGTDSIESKTFKAMTKKQRLEELPKRKCSNDEIERLRKSCILDNNFPLLDLVPSDKDKQKGKSLTIMFQNVQFLALNRTAIANDFGYEQADIIILIECHNNAQERARRDKDSQVFSLTHDLICYTAGTAINTSNGTVCYVRKRRNLQLIAHNADDNYEFTTGNNNRILFIQIQSRGQRYCSNYMCLQASKM